MAFNHTDLALDSSGFFAEGRSLANERQAQSRLHQDCIRGFDVKCQALEYPAVSSMLLASLYRSVAQAPGLASMALHPAIKVA